MAKKGGSIFDAFKGLAPKKGPKTKDKDIEKYEKILSEQPDDRNALNTLGDLYVKAGDVDKACEHYLRVGELYAKDGFTLKAIAVYKKAQRAKPDVINTYLVLADLYVQKGLIGEAKANYLTVADMQAAAGAKHESLDTYHKIADLDPRNINIRSKLATMYEKENFAEDAAVIYAEIGDIALQDDPKNGKEYYQHALKLQPENQEILARIGYSYAEHQMRQEAAAIFKKLLKLNPGNIDYQEQLDELSAVPGPQPLPVEAETISFSEEELTTLNLGEPEPVSLLEMDLTEGASPPSAEEHVLDFPFSGTSQDDSMSLNIPDTQEPGTDDHALDFQIEEQGTISWEGGATQVAPLTDSEDHIFALSMEESSHEDEQMPPQEVSAGEAGYFDLASRLETAVKIGQEYDHKEVTLAPEESRLKVEASEQVAAGEVSDIIKEFKQGVMEEVGTEDYETHYELGISYKEMELYDDAIEELKLAALEPSKFADCYGVIGLCYIEMDEHDNALQAFQQARANVPPKREQYQDLTYQIGLTYEDMDDIAMAAQTYQELFQCNPKYRDIKQKLNKLLGG